jgi:F420-dependent oxidoreductase-like protein
MRFSFWVGNGHPWSEILRSATRAEETGWDGVWFADHFMPLLGDTTKPIHEVWTVLSALGAVTERVRLGPLVCGNTYRNPSLLAKQAVSADHISHGRIVLGLGAGWQENEHEAYGFEFGTFTDRFEKLEEALQILRSLRSEERTTFDGGRYQIADAPLSPKPVGDLPIMIGGGGERKTLRMVAQYADEWNVWADPEIMAQKSKVLDQHCEDQGRDPASIQRSAVALLFLCDSEERATELRGRGIERPSLIGTPDQLQEQMAAFVEIGVDEVIIPDFNLGGGAGQDETADRFLAEVAAPFRQ